MTVHFLSDVYAINPDGTKDYSKFRGREWETAHEGCVIKVYNNDYRAMSDVWTYAKFALVWENGEAKEILVNANFECDNSCGFAIVDATPEVIAEYQKYVQLRKEAHEIAEEKRREILENLEKEKPAIGRKVEVVKGRKVKIGTQGVIFWIGNGSVGVATSDRKGNVEKNGKTYKNVFLDTFFVPEQNVKVITDKIKAA